MAKLTVEEIRKTPLFSNVEQETLEELLPKFEQIFESEDVVILAPNEPNDSIYLIREGELRIVLDDKRKTVISRLGCGECVGELSVLDQQLPSAYVITDTPVELFGLKRVDLWNLIDTSHSVARNLLYILSSRLRNDNLALCESITLQALHKQAARKDGLTGLHNRLWLDEMLPEFVGYSNLRNTPLALLLLDIDCFKQYNDLLGHQAGDNALKILARVLRDNSNGNAYAARYGGEEFVMLFPGLHASFLGQAAQKICDATRAFSITNDKNQLLPGITVSIGAAMLEPGQTGDDLIRIADQALYLAKQQGRDRVVVLSMKYGSAPN